MSYTLPSLSAEEALQRSRAVLVDLRKPAAREADGQTVEGALIRDPFTFGHDDPLAAEEREIVVFCVHGHEVSRFGCALLLVHGRNAHFVEGGYEALKAADAPLVPLS